MVILHVLNTGSFSGAENVVISIINEFQKRNIENIELIYVSLEGSIRKRLEKEKIKYEPIKKMSVGEIKRVIKKYNPDIIVITGHDALYRKKRKDNSYKSSDEFVAAIKTARKYENSHEKLIIIAGACQSNYEELIKAGANFASSPKRINIHALDPAIIATCLAFSDKNKDIDLIKILNKTKYGSDGIGGIITKGTMYVGYPR